MRQMKVTYPQRNTPDNPFFIIFDILRDGRWKVVERSRAAASVGWDKGLMTSDVRDSHPYFSFTDLPFEGVFITEVMERVEGGE